MGFEKKIEKIESLIKDMESGLDLQKSLKKFEEGVSLIKECQKEIKEAELRLEKVLSVDEDGKASTENN